MSTFTSLLTEKYLLDLEIAASTKHALSVRHTHRWGGVAVSLNMVGAAQTPHLPGPKSSSTVDPATQYPRLTSAWNHFEPWDCPILNSAPSHGNTGGDGDGDGGGNGFGGGDGGGGGEGGGGGGGDGGDGGGDGG